MTTHPIHNLLDKWPSRKELAKDAGVDVYAVHRWYQRGHIPPKHDACLLDAAHRRGFSLSWQELVKARSEAEQMLGADNFKSQGAA